ncbi:hypothetical protein [Treponema sp.]|uniref:hypothetical protein n=1 Tax=Treponema sp. TaxID=166 RepID=UPI003EFCA204
MNTIPSIFNQRKVSYIVLGGSENPRQALMPVTCVVLSRSGRHYRARVIENLLQKRFEKIISVSPKSEQKSVDLLARQFPTVKFLVVLDSVSQGELLNLAFYEAQTPYVLVVQEEMCLDKFSFDASMAEKFARKKQFCIAPKLLSSSFTKLPVSFFPSARKSVFEVGVDSFFADGQPSLYPADYAGFYDREKFILLGGADYTISSEYWQKIDLFFRAWLWGEKINLSSFFEFKYSGNIPEENLTVDISYLRFYLKNLLPVFLSDHAKIPWYSYFIFKLKSSCGFVESMRQFKDAVRWTRENQYRFKLDAVSLIENWGKK